MNQSSFSQIPKWASSRPDLFGEDFCEVFSRLQDDTTPHELEHTIKILEDAYGKDWENQIQLGEIIGSGCIGQGKDYPNSLRTLTHR